MDVATGDILTVSGANSVTLSGGDTLNAGSSSVAVTDAGNDDTSTLGAGSAVTIDSGSGDVIAGTSVTVSMIAGLGASVSGLYDTVKETSGDTIQLSGSGGDLIQASGTGDAVTIGSGTEDTVEQSSGSVSVASGLWAEVAGNGNIVASSSTDYLVIDGNSDTIKAGGNGSYISLDGSSESVTATGTGNTIDASGQGDSVTMSDGSITLEEGTWIGLSGASDTIDETSDDTVQLYGNGGDGVQASGAGDSVSIDSGSGDVIAGTSVTVSMSAGLGALIGGLYDTVKETSDDTIQLSGGGGDLIQASGAGDAVTIDSGTEDTVEQSSGSVSVASGLWTEVAGNGNIVASSSTDYLVISGNSDTIEAGGNGSYISLDGSAETVTATGTGDAVDATGQGDSVIMSSGSVTLEAGTWIGLSGASDTVDETGGGDILQLYGAGGDTVQEGGAGDSVTIEGSTGDTVTLSGDDTLTLEGAAAGDTTVAITGSGSDEVVSDWTTGGSQETVYDPSNGLASETYNYTGADGTGSLTSLREVETGGESIVEDFSGNGSYEEYVYAPGGAEISWADYNSGGGLTGSGSFSDTGGSGGEGSDGGGSDGGGSGGGGSDDEGGDKPDTDYGFANGTTVSNVNIGPIEQADLAAGNAVGAFAAEVALGEVDDAVALNTQAAVLSGSKWASPVVTWSMASVQGEADGSAITAEVEQAFAAWSAATGIQFKEVTDPSQAGIEVGFSDFDTDSSGVAGYTTVQDANGQIQSAGIQVEDPGETALATNASGQLVYSGSNTSFEQDVMHEIGHALGFADNADPNSVMYYELTGSDQKLDANDLAGIQALYDSGTAAAGSVITLAQLIQSMATFSAGSGAASTALTPAQMNSAELMLTTSHA